MFICFLFYVCNLSSFIIIFKKNIELEKADLEEKLKGVENDLNQTRNSHDLDKTTHLQYVSSSEQYIVWLAKIETWE